MAIAAAAAAGTQQLLKGVFRGRTPVTLFRIQTSAKAVSLREEAAQREAGRTSFDLTLVPPALCPVAGGAPPPLIVAPRDPAETRFLGPNGMSLRPAGFFFAVLLHNFKGRCTIFEVPAGSQLTDELVLFHEHSDHYSVQTTKEVSLAAFNKRLSAFLLQPGVVASDKAAFYVRHPEMTNMAMGFSENA